MADVSDNSQNGNALPALPSEAEIAPNKNRITLARRKAVLLIGLILIVALASVTLLTFQST